MMSHHKSLVAPGVRLKQYYPEFKLCLEPLFDVQKRFGIGLIDNQTEYRSLRIAQVGNDVAKTSRDLSRVNSGRMIANGNRR